MPRNSAYQHITGMDTVSHLLDQLPFAVRDKVTAYAMAQAAVPFQVWQKRFAKRSERTGALRDSISVKVKKLSGGKVTAIIGPSRDYYRLGRKLKRGAGRQGSDRPANYAHLVEFGHHVVAPRKGTSIRKKTATVTGWVPAKPFVRPAALMAAPEAAGIFQVEVREGIARETQRLVKQAG